MALLSCGLADESIENLSQPISLLSQDAVDFENIEDDLIDEKEAELDAEELTEEDVSTIENLGGDPIEEDIEVDEADVSPLDTLLGEKFTGEDVQTIEPVSEESEDEGNVSYSKC